MYKTLISHYEMRVLGDILNKLLLNVSIRY